jgi:hypothetical protein
VIKHVSCADRRGVVLHVIGSTAMYRSGRLVDQGQVWVGVRGLLAREYRRMEDPDTRSFDRMVAGCQLEHDLSQVCGDVFDLAADGLMDLVGAACGEWSLTPAGVSAVLSARSSYDPRNVTMEWMDRFMTPDQYQRMVRHVTNKVKHSRDGAEIRGLVHEYVALVGRRDGLRDRILAGDDPSPSAIRSWIWRQVLSTFRNEGTDAQTRSVKGARTERDLRGETPADAYHVPEHGVGVAVHDVDDDGATASSTAVVDVVDWSAGVDDLLAHHDAMTRGMARLEAAVRAYKPGAADRYARVLGHMASGMSPAEVAVTEGVSPARAATLIAEVRAAGRVRARVDRVRVAVVRYVANEPMSTMADLADVGADAVDVGTAVRELVDEGVLRRRGASFYVTPRAATLL